MMPERPSREPLFRLALANDPGVEFFAERLRDGRLALGTRASTGQSSRAGELHLLGPGEASALAGWLAPLVEETWRAALHERREELLRTAADLHGDGTAGVERLAQEVIRELPAGLLRRALLLLANAIGPEARERLVTRLNQTQDRSEEAVLRGKLAEEGEAFAYALAAAALFDVLDEGLLEGEGSGG
jgi:hypothetical protein